MKIFNSIIKSLWLIGVIFACILSVAIVYFIGSLAYDYNPWALPLLAAIACAILAGLILNREFFKKASVILILFSLFTSCQKEDLCPDYPDRIPCTKFSLTSILTCDAGETYDIRYSEHQYNVANGCLMDNLKDLVEGENADEKALWGKEVEDIVGADKFVYLVCYEL